MGIFDGMAQGLRAAGSVFSPQVGQQLEQERLLESQQGNTRQNLMLQQLIKATESGAVDPNAVAPLLKQMGMDLPPGALGPTPEVRAKLIEMKRNEAKTAYLQTPEAQKFISAQDDVGLIRDMARRQLIPIDEALKAMKEAREAGKVISLGGGQGAVPDGAGGYTRMPGGNPPPAPHTTEQEYKDPATGEVKKRLLQWDPQRNGYVPTNVFDPAQQPPPMGPQPGATGEPIVAGNMQGDPRAIMAEIARIKDPAERADALQSYRMQLAQGPQAAPIFKPTAAQKAPTGFRYKPDGTTLEPIPGGPADQGPMSPEALASAAASIASGMPAVQVISGYGRVVAARREEARVEAIKLIQSQNPGMTAAAAGEEFVNRNIDFIAGKRSVTQLNTMLGATRQAVDQLEFNVDKVTEAMKKLPGSDLSPIFNAIIRQEEKWTGDPAYSSLYYYMHAAAMESAKILQGGQASVAQLHAGAAEEAKKWADANFTTPKQWLEGVAPAMKEEGAYRLKTYQSAIDKQRVGANRQPVPTSALNPALQSRLDAYK